MGEKRCTIGKKYDTVRRGGNYPVLVDMFTKKYATVQVPGTCHKQLTKFL